MKAGKSCNYYDGEISDDHSSLRFCGFSVTACKKLEECYENGEPVLLDGCEVKKLDRDGLEVLVKTGTEITKSQKSFEITKDKGITPLKEVQDLPQYQQIHVRAKVIHVEEAFELRNGGTVQEAVIAFKYSV